MDSKNNKKKYFIIGGVLAVLLVIIGSVWADYSINKKSSVKTASGINNQIKKQPLSKTKIQGNDASDHVKALRKAFYSGGKNDLYKEASQVQKLGKDALPELFDIAGNKNENPILRKMAFELIRNIGPSREDANLLINIIKDKSDNPYLRGEAAWTLGLTHSAQALNPLIEVLKNKKEDARIRKLSAVSLGVLANQDAQEVLIQVAADVNDNAKVRSAAVGALGSFKSQEAHNAVISLLKDQSWQVQVAAAKCLSKCGDSDTVTALNAELINTTINNKKAKSDENDAVVQSIIDSLTQIKSPKSVAVLIEVLKGNDGFYRALAGQALGEIGDKKALGPVKEALDKAADPFDVRLLTEAYKKLSQTDSKPDEK